MKHIYVCNVILLLFILQTSLHYVQGWNGEWTKANCSRKILGMTQLPNNNYFSGEVVDIVDGIFGPALYFRSTAFCSDYFFAIPLPFSACSIAYLDGQFYVLRDDGDYLNSNLYVIRDYNLIGAYLYWIIHSKLQCQFCNATELPKFFDLNNQQQICSWSSNNDPYLCSVDIDTLFAKERLNLSLDAIHTSGEKKYKEVYEKFIKVSENSKFEERLWLWINWNLYEYSANRFTSVHGSAIGNFLLLRKPTFTYMKIDGYGAFSTDLLIKSSSVQFVTMTSFDFGGEVTLIAIDLDGILNIIDYRRGIKIKVGRLPVSLQQMFVMDNNLLIGVDIFFGVYYSVNYISDILIPLTLCENDFIPFENGCYHFINMPFPFQTSVAEEKCELKNLVYEEGKAPAISSQIHHVVDPKWHVHSNGHHYKISEQSLPYDEAFEYCQKYSNTEDVSHLLIIKHEEDFAFMTSLLSKENIDVRYNPLWVGARFSNELNEWIWLDGSVGDFLKYFEFSLVEHCILLQHNSSSEKSSLQLSRAPCSKQAFFICEKYRVCWDFFYDTKVFNNFDLLNDAIHSNIFFLGSISNSSKNPLKECASLCQQHITIGCFSFSYFHGSTSIIEKKYIRGCFGRNLYNFSVSETIQSSNDFHSGVMQTCRGSSLRPATSAMSNSFLVEKSFRNSTKMCGADGVPCVFPFTYNGKKYSACTKTNYHSLWCSYDAIYKGRYGVCKPCTQIDACDVVHMRFLKKCAVSAVSRSDCENKGCCYKDIPGFSENCFYPIPSKSKYTRDGWLRSPYSSYEYGLMYFHERINMSHARELCQKQGGELAYVGIMEKESFRYILKKLLKNEYRSGSVFLGLRSNNDNHFKRLDGKVGGFTYWSINEPGPESTENCVASSYLSNNFWVDIDCSYGLKSSLCQKLSYRCDVDVESRVPCTSKIYFNASKSICIANGCCFEEPLHGNATCYKSIRSGSRFSPDGWLISPYSSYEYNVISHSSGFNMSTARYYCQQHNGELAYVGIMEEKSHRYIFDHVMVNLNFDGLDDSLWLGLVSNNDNKYVLLNKKVGSFSNWTEEEPNLLSENCAAMALNLPFLPLGWLDVPCSKLLRSALCQRLNYYCDLAVESRLPCSSEIPFNASKSECISHGCCFEEPISGNNTCYKSGFSGEDPSETKEVWWKSTSNSYEYAVINYKGSWDEAQLACLDNGGVPAYSGFLDQASYSALYSNLMLTNIQHTYLGLGITDIIKNGEYAGLDGVKISWNKFYADQPTVEMHSSCVRVDAKTGYWSNANCNKVYATGVICQRIPDRENDVALKDVLSWKSSFNDYEYTLVQVFGDWYKANMECLRHDSVLAYTGFFNVETYSLIYKNLIELHKDKLDEVIWFGLNDLKTEGEYVGLDGKIISQKNWETSEPTGNKKQNCGVVVVNNGQWRDTHCDRNFNYAICEKRFKNEITIACDNQASDSQFSGVNRVEVICPPGCLSTEFKVWGTQVYTADSSICKAAIHAGVITDSGGEIVFHHQPGQNSYTGSLQNSIHTQDYTKSWPASFSFEEKITITCDKKARDSQFSGVNRVEVICPPGCLSTEFKVWGTQVYTVDSSICKAAIHAGVITDNGGEIIIHHQPGRTSYSGSLQNSILTLDYTTHWPASFSFEKKSITQWWKSASTTYEYMVTEVHGGWYKANVECLNHGGVLAFTEFSNSTSYSSIFENLILKHQLHPFLWFGLNDLYNEGEFVGLDDKKFNETNWAASHPSTKVKRRLSCVKMNTLTREWQLENCFVNISAAICERAVSSDNFVQKNASWWKSTFNYYEYAIIEVEKDWYKASMECLHHGAVLAYTGFSNIETYSILYEKFIKLQHQQYNSLWFGVYGLKDEGMYRYVGLDEKEINQPNWNQSEPTRGNTDYCIQIDPSTGYWFDSSCKINVTAAICEKKSKIVLERNVSWWKSTFNNYEYAVIKIDENWFTATSACLHYGGVLAYIGFSNMKAYSLLFDNLIQLNQQYERLWFGLNDLYNEGEFVGLDDKKFNETNWAVSHPKSGRDFSCSSINTTDGEWKVKHCAMHNPAAICQRALSEERLPMPKTNLSIRTADIACKVSGFNLCQQYAFNCPHNSICLDHEDWFECVCQEGFTGNGEVCVPLQPCPDGWLEEASGCYNIKIGTASFYEAEENCQQVGGHLISVHSVEEYSLLKGMLARYGSKIMFWIGLRRNIPFVSRNGQAYGGCGLWSDGSDCVSRYMLKTFHDIVNIEDVQSYECYAFDGKNWTEQMCAISLPYSAGATNGYVCKLHHRPLYLNVTLTSLSWDVYPGFGDITVNGKSITKRNSISSERGCVHIASFTVDGVAVNVYTVCNDDELVAMQNISDFMSTSFLSHPKEVYFAVVSDGRINPTIFQHLGNEMQSIGVSWKQQFRTQQEFEEQVFKQDISESELLPKNVIYKCDDCIGLCDGVAIFRDETTTCRSYYNGRNVSASFTMTKLSWEKAGQDKKVVSFRSKTIKNVTSNSTLTCPWASEDVEGFGVKITNIKDDIQSMSSTAECKYPPCVHQIACKRPGRLSNTSNTHAVVGETYVLLCKRIKSSSFICPINVQGSYFRGALKESILLPVTLSAPLFATFDDLLHLGSPPFEFGSIYGPHNITWKPLRWTWENNKYGSLVPGIREKAIRFRKEQVHTPNYVCWWDFDGTNECPHGLTVSFWIRVMEWPKDVFVTVIRSGSLQKNWKGLYVYLKPSEFFLFVKIRQSDKGSSRSIPLKLHKWTHVWFVWNATSNSLQITYDWLYTSLKSTPSPSFSAFETPSENFVIGSNASNDNTFDLDDLHVFAYAMTAEELKLHLPESSLQLRHYLVDANPSNSYYPPETLHGGSLCTTVSNYYGCGDFVQKCLGSVMYCPRGFNLAFTLKLPDITSTVFGKYHVMLITNLADKTEWSDYAENKKSYGFRVYAVKDMSSWNVAFKHTFSPNATYQPELSWLVEPEIKVTFWLQYHPDGLWVFCFRWPTQCQKQVAMPFSNALNYVTWDAFTQFSIGPVIVKNEDITLSSSLYPSIEITNVWFVEESFDMVMFSDEINFISTPIHWQTTSDKYASVEGYQFQEKGFAGAVRFEPSHVFGEFKFHLQNKYEEFIDRKNSGISPKDAVAWMELGSETLKNIQCLNNMNKCSAGFTLQFWLKLNQCSEKVAFGRKCYIISVGELFDIFPQGFAFYYSSTDESFHVIAATVRRIWRLSFKADLSTLSRLVRITWHPENGISLFLNDIPMLRKSSWEPVALPPIFDDSVSNDAEYFKYKQNYSLTIGKRSDLDMGFTDLAFHDMYFWNGVVEGMPFNSIRTSCAFPWYQIGQSCYLKETNKTKPSQAVSNCRDKGATLASVPSLAAYTALKEYLNDNDTSRCWVGGDKTSPGSLNMKWDSSQIDLSTWNFDAFSTLKQYQATSLSSLTFYGEEMTSGFDRPELVFVNYKNQNYNYAYICAKPFNQDLFYRGCFDATKGPILDAFRQSELESVHAVSSDVSANISNSLGSYNLPYSCRKLCFMKHRSKVIGLSDFDCYCFDETFVLENLPSVDDVENDKCSSTHYISADDGFVHGFRTLQFKDEKVHYSTSQRYHNCGPIYDGGVYKCGKESLPNVKFMAVHGFADLDFEDSSFKYISDVNPLIYLTSSKVYQNSTITVALNELRCCGSVAEEQENDVCSCLDSLIELKLDFGDSCNHRVIMRASEASSYRLPYAYNDAGRYSVVMKVRNSQYSAYVTTVFRITVLELIDKPVLNFTRIDAVQPTQLTDITTTAFMGSKMTCTWIYGDGSPDESVYVAQLPVPKAHHRYQLPGVYKLIVHCTNDIGGAAISTLAIVHESISDIHAPSDAIVKYGDPYEHEWTITKGSHIKCQVYFSNQQLPEVNNISLVINNSTGAFYFDNKTSRGVAYIPHSLYASSINYDSFGNVFSVLVTCSNAVTNPFPFALTYISVEAPIDGFTTNTTSPTFIKPEEIICISYNIDNGTNIIFKVTYDSASYEDETEFCGITRCQKRILCFSQEESGNYTVTATAVNAISKKVIKIILIVVFPIKKINIIAIPAHVPFQLSEIILIHSPPVPTGYIEIDFGDLQTEKFELNFTFTGIFHEMKVQHRYHKLGIYTLKTISGNLVSSLESTTQIQIGLDLGRLQIFLATSRFASSYTEKVLFYTFLVNGSSPVYEVGFGDGTPNITFGGNITRASPEDADIHYFHHVYVKPGTYVVCVEAKNLFGSTHACSEEIVVLNSLQSSFYSLVPNFVGIVSYPPGDVWFDAHLEKNDSNPDPALPSNVSGWANDVRASWLLVKPNIRLVHQSFQKHDLDLFPYKYSFTKDHVGNISIHVQLSNSVSQLRLEYDFQLVEVLKGLLLKVDSIEGTVVDIDFGTAPLNISVLQQVTFSFTVLQGSHVTFVLDYGDGDFQEVVSPYLFASDFLGKFVHRYKSKGIYSVNVTAKNEVSELFHYFQASINVYEPIQNISSKIEMIDIDSDLYDVDVFMESSEMYALIYGKPVVQSIDQPLVLPLNRPIFLKVGLLSGSNASITWEFKTSNITLEFDGTAIAFTNETDVDYVMETGIIEDEFMKLKILKKLADEETKYLSYNLKSKLDMTVYTFESSVMVEYEKPGIHLVNIHADNPISSESLLLTLDLKATIQGLNFVIFKPPVVNRTCNILFNIAQVGSDSCFVFSPGDLSDEIAFGFNMTYCTKVRGINPEMFYQLKQNKTLYLGRNFSDYNVTGNLRDGTAKVNFSVQHIYSKLEQYTIRLLGINEVSRVKRFTEVIVTEILCDYPSVELEKQADNSIERPKKSLSFLTIQRYTSIKTKCKLTSLTNITWHAYEMEKLSNLNDINLISGDIERNSELPNSVKAFSSILYSYKYIPGLKYSSKSEDIAIPPGVLSIGLNLICVTVSMVGFENINSSDCVYVDTILPPLVAGFVYGVRRSIGYGNVVQMDALSASYDPNLQSQYSLEYLLQGSNPSNLAFQISCPFRVEKDTADIADEDEWTLMFGGKPNFVEKSFCNRTTITCLNTFHVIMEILTVVFTNETELFNVSWAKEMLVLSINTTCLEKPTCDLSTIDLLKSLDVNETIKESLCMKVEYRCDISNNSSSFDYVNSNNTCIPSGFYPTYQNTSSEMCHSVVAENHDSCGKVEVDTSTLLPLASYMIRVHVMDFKTNRKTVGSQVIEILLGDPPKLRINCKLNCGIKINAKLSVVVEVVRINDYDETISHNQSRPIAYSWSLYEIQTKSQQRKDLKENLNLIPVSDLINFAATGIHGTSLVIKPGLLVELKKYRIRVTGAVYGSALGLTETEVIPNLPPYNGICFVTPNKGIVLNDTFTISCENWLDEGINVDRNIPLEPNEFQLSYKVYCGTTGDSQLSLISRGNNATVSQLYLPVGLEENDYKYIRQVFIQVHVVDAFGAKTVVNLTAQVYSSMELSSELLENLTSKEISQSDSQSIAQFSATVGAILNKMNDTTNNSASFEESNDSEKELRKSMRGQIIKALDEKINPDSDLNGIQQSCSAVSTLTAVPEEVADDTQNIAIDLLLERSGRMSELSEDSSSEDVEETAIVVVNGVENIVESARLQVVGNSPTTDPHSSLVPLPVFSFQEAQNVSKRITVDEEEMYLSPEERIERRQHQEQDRIALHNQRKNQSMNIGKKSASSLSSISESLVRNKVPGEPSVQLEAKGLKLEAQKSTSAELRSLLSLNRTTNTTSSAISLILQKSNVNFEDWDSPGDDEPIETDLMTQDENPYIWDGSADNVRSSVVTFSLKLPNGRQPFRGRNNSFRLELPVKSSISNLAPQFFNFTPSGKASMSFHEFTAKQPDDVIFLTVNPNLYDEAIRMRLYFQNASSLKIFPDLDNYTFVWELPDYEKDPENPYRIRIDASDLPTLGRYVYGIVQIDDEGNITSESSMTLYNYTIYNMVTSCRFWNETTETWECSGCRVSIETSKTKVVCLCNHLTSFGADFLVAPNPIDFAALASKLQNLKDNLSVLMTIISLLVLYVIGVIYCRRQDKRDVSKWSVSLLMDNSLCDEYFYQIVVKTGSMRQAETSSKIFFILVGEEHQTPLRMLSDKSNTKFERGSIRKFLVAVDEPLGALSYLKIWHDNSGKNSLASWYLENIIVTDLRTKERYYFFCDDWLAVDESDGQIERVLPVATNEEISSFNHIFASSTKRDFSDGHLWFSLLSRPMKSHFTRVQRLTCALAILFSTMLVSAMFFGKDEEAGENEGTFEIGPIKLSVKQFVISIEASLIVIPVNVLLVQLFRRSRLKEEASNEKDDIGSFVSKSVESIDAEIDRKEGRADNKGFQFPYWATYIAWVLAFIVSGSSASFVFMYSIEWGPAKSQEWLISIIMSFTQSIFIIQPAKVIFGAFVLSFFVNRCAQSRADQLIRDAEENVESKDDAEIFKQKEEEWLLQDPMDDQLEKLRYSKGAINQTELEEARKKSLQHKLMMSTIYELVSYLLYVILLLVAANTAKDPQAFQFHKSLSDVFLTKGSPAFEEIRTPVDFWNWCHNGLIPGLHAPSWYNGKRVTWDQSRFISNRETFVTGPARIRQLRVQEESCITEDTSSLVERDCICQYSIVNQETRDFTPEWAEEASDLNSTSSPWMFQNFLDLGGFAYPGLMNLYDGGGYSVTLKNTAKASKLVLEELQDQNWIDRGTVAVFVEFTVYNANVNLFGSVVLLLERSPNGAFFPHPTIATLRLYDFINSKGVFLIAIYVVFVLVLVYNIQDTVRKIIVEKKKYFNSFWRITDLIGMVCSITAVAFYACRTIHANIAMSKITDDQYKETFINFQYVVMWGDMFRYLLAFTLFLATIKFTKLLHFNRRIQLLTRTLRFATQPVLYFTLMFGIYFMAFLFLAHIWFEQRLYSYSSLYLTAEELFSMLLGRFDFTQLKTAGQLLGPIFFIVFTGSLTITLLNMFICILDDSIKKARAEIEGLQNEFEVVEFIKEKAKNYIYGLLPKVLQQTKQEEEDLPVYIEYPEDVLHLRIDSLAKYVDKMEAEFYASVTLEELQAEADLDDEDFTSI